MENKINDARNYVINAIINGADATESQNDAANIFAANYDEYMAIWEALRN